MTGNEYLKQKREEKKYTIRGFAKESGIAPRMVSYYESGEKQLSSIPIEKAIRLFSLLDIDIEEFFCIYYPYKKDLDKAVATWNEENKREYDVNSLKKRYYYRLMKIKERDSLALRDYECLYTIYKELFDKNIKECDSITNDEYEKYILSLNYQIRLKLNPLPANVIAKKILDSLYHTEYLISDLSKFCGVSYDHLRGCLDGNYDISRMRVGLALSLCHILNVSFKDVFVQNISFLS